MSSLEFIPIADDECGNDCCHDSIEDERYFTQGLKRQDAVSTSTDSVEDERIVYQGLKRQDGVSISTDSEDEQEEPEYVKQQMYYHLCMLNSGSIRNIEKKMTIKDSMFEDLVTMVEKRMSKVDSIFRDLLTKIDNSDDEIMVLKNENKHLRELITQLQREVL